jgi:membrane associated rhomboid family serine protease
MQFQGVVPLTPAVKGLLIVNVVIWIVGQLLIGRHFLGEGWIELRFGLVPLRVLEDFWLWQILTYIFLHSSNVLHIVFNLLLVWWLGGELESRWGSRFFLTYYISTGVGAGLIYLLGMLVYALATGVQTSWTTPVVGASGAVFGLMLAYGILFGDRVVYFLLIFPMQAKYFVMILGAVEVVQLLNSGVGGGVATLAHIGGLISGFLFLRGYTWWQQRQWRVASNQRKTTRSNLKLVVNNDDRDPEDPNSKGPKYWN